ARGDPGQWRMIVEDPSKDARDPAPRGLPVAFDPEATTAEPGLPGFLARPAGAPVYHGFVVLDDIEADGFRFGIISHLQAPPSPWGDAFVIAPDNSRAGLVWELSSELYLREIIPFQSNRWGVWGIGFRLPMRSPEDARRNLEAILPLLKEQWNRWRSGE